jgi:hypothetical protein
MTHFKFFENSNRKVDISVDTGFIKGDELLNPILEKISDLLNLLYNDDYRTRGSRYSGFEKIISGGEYLDTDEIRKIEKCSSWSDDKIYERFSDYLDMEIQDYADQLDYSWLRTIDFTGDTYHTYIKYIPTVSLSGFEENVEDTLREYKRILGEISPEDLKIANEFYSDSKKQTRRAIELGLRDLSEPEESAVEIMKEAEEISHVLENLHEEIETISKDLDQEAHTLEIFRKNIVKSFIEFLEDE